MPDTTKAPRIKGSGLLRDFAPLMVCVIVPTPVNLTVSHVKLPLLAAGFKDKLYSQLVALCKMTIFSFTKNLNPVALSAE